MGVQPVGLLSRVSTCQVQWLGTVLLAVGRSVVEAK
jgi:hypothetical protein